MHHLCIFMLLFAQLTLSSAGQVRVLCIGSDGHVSIEQAHAICEQSADDIHPHAASPNTPACDDTRLASASDCDCQNHTDCPILCVSSAPCDDLPLPAPLAQLTVRNQSDTLSITDAPALPWTGELLPVALPASVYSQPAFDEHATWHRHQIHLTLASTILQI